MDEDGLPTLFLDTRPDFRFQFHLRCYEKKKKNTELEKTVLWNLSKLLSLFDTNLKYWNPFWTRPSSRSFIIPCVSLRESASVDGR